MVNGACASNWEKTLISLGFPILIKFSSCVIKTTKYSWIYWLDRQIQWSLSNRLIESKKFNNEKNKNARKFREFIRYNQLKPDTQNVI